MFFFSLVSPIMRIFTSYLVCFYILFSVDGVAVPEEEEESYAWLQERDKPEDLAVNGAMYRGPKIVNN